MKSFVYRDYDQYLQTQRVHESTKDRTRNKSYKKQIEIIKLNFPHVKRVLCIGARDEAEVIAFRNAGYDAIGIDLFSSNTDIVKIVDMNKIQDNFEEDEYDLIFSCHSLEHAYDPSAVFCGIRKIAKRGCFLILPNGSEPPSAKDPIMYNFMEKIKNDPDIARDVLKTDEIQQEFSMLMGSKVDLIYYNFVLPDNSRQHEHWLCLRW